MQAWVPRGDYKNNCLFFFENKTTRKHTTNFVNTNKCISASHFLGVGFPGDATFPSPGEWIAREMEIFPSPGKWVAREMVIPPMDKRATWIKRQHG